MTGLSITARDLTKTFGHVRALGPLELDVQAGQMLCVRGANGSGKTTLLNLLGTACKPSAGTLTICIGTRELTLQEIRACTGQVGHALGLYADLSTHENVVLRAALHIHTANIEPLYTALGMQGFIDRPVRVLSRGQRQKAALLMSLLGEPKLLLWDEPSTGLDTRAVASMLDVLVAANQRGCTCVLITHDTHLQAELSKRVALTTLELVAGRVNACTS